MQELKEDHVCEALSNIDFTVDEKTVLTDCLAKRWDFMYSDAHGLAHYFDPRFSGKYLTAPMKLQIERYILSHHTDIIKNAELLVYKAHINSLKEEAPNFADNIGAKNSPVTLLLWWEAVDVDSGFPNIRKLAIRLASLCATSSASERNFSTFAFIHNKLRNRLKDSTLERLVYIFSNRKELQNKGFTKRAQEPEFESDLIDELTVEL